MNSNDSLLAEDLLPTIRKLKTGGKKIIYAQGFFDLLHIGHVYHLEQAKKLGDLLIVGVVADRFFNKRSGRTLFKENERLKYVAVLDCVDFVVLNNAPDATAAIIKIKPDIYAKGEDVKAKAINPAENLYREIRSLETVGGKICFTKSLPIHTSDLLALLAKAEDSRDEVKDKLFNPLMLPEIILAYNRSFKKSI